ncbi:hypothetical protein IE53DRAFT_370206 [Violaceomyces palustris]|uniref:Uncharacterized protein n=1 Tax=Violaceomyces palustris TaxID=1673888 RepID=A0ACD0NT49_9BASI|nr:hypothetical protein IE53DRAFT_370206 [Violaceomyces palustris]
MSKALRIKTVDFHSGVPAPDEPQLTINMKPIDVAREETGVEQSCIDDNESLADYSSTLIMSLKVMKSTPTEPLSYGKRELDETDAKLLEQNLEVNMHFCSRSQTKAGSSRDGTKDVLATDIKSGSIEMWAPPALDTAKQDLKEVVFWCDGD